MRTIGLCIVSGILFSACVTAPVVVPATPVAPQGKEQSKPVQEEQVQTRPMLALGATSELGFEVAVVTNIVDGETVDVRYPDGRIERVRINTINAAERGLPYWLLPTELLEELILGKQVFLEAEDVDSQPYFRSRKHPNKRRLLRNIHIRGEDGSLLLVSEILVEQGLVWVSPMPQSKKQFKKKPKNCKYLQRLRDAEQRARDAQRGIWHGNTSRTTRADPYQPAFHFC